MRAFCICYEAFSKLPHKAYSSLSFWVPFVGFLFLGLISFSSSGLFWGIKWILGGVWGLGALLDLLGGVFSLGFYFFYSICAILVMPFYMLLAERVLKNMGALPNTKRGLVFQVRMLWVGMVKMFFLLTVGLVLWVLSLAPHAQLLCGFLGFVVMAFDMCDYSFEALGYSFKKRLDFWGQNFVEFLGLGLFLGLCSLVPVISFISWPITLVASAYYVAKRS